MDDRAARLVARGLVAAVAVSAVIAANAARVVLSHGSGTYLALLVFLPLLVAPGGLIWRWPQARYLALWSLAGLIATIVWTVFGDPYRYERELAEWSYVSTPVAVTIGLVLFAAPLAAVLLKQRERVTDDRALLAQRLGRVAVLVLAIAAGVAVTALVTFGIDGMSLVAYTAGLVAPSLAVQWFPRKLTAGLWTVLCAPFAALGIWLWLVFGESLTGPAHVIELGLGTLYVLVLVAVPLICTVTPTVHVTDRSARAMYRARRGVRA